MKQRRVSCLLARTGIAAAVFAGRAQAQGEAELFEWPQEAGEPTSFLRSVPARLSGDERRDVAVLGNGQVVVWFEPSAHQMVARLPFDFVVHDAAALPWETFAPAENRDALVLAADDALRWGGINADGSVHAHVIDRSLSWRDARRVLAADLTADARVDLVVLKNDGRTIAVKRQTSTGAYVDEPAMGWVAAADVRDLALLEFDGNADTHELALLDTGGLRVFALDGALLATYDPVRSDLDAMTVLRADGTIVAADRVLWSTAAFADPGDLTRALFVVDAAGAALATITGAPITALSSGRLDFDTSADAVAMLGLEEQLALLYAQFDADGMPNGFDFGPQHAIVCDLLPPGSGVVTPAPALIADLGNDAVEDLFAPLATARKVRVTDGPLARSNELDALPGASPDFVHDGACWEPLGTSEGRIIYARAVFPGVDGYPSGSGWKLEHRVYVKPQGADWLVPLPTSSCAKPVGEYAVEGELDTVEIGFECPDVEDAHYLYLRVVHVNGTTIDEAGPALLGVFTEDEVAKDEILLGLIAPDWTIENVESCAAGGTRVAGFGRVRRIPPPPPGVPPPPPPPPPGNCHDHIH